MKIEIKVVKRAWLIIMKYSQFTLLNAKFVLVHTGTVYMDFIIYG